MVRVSALAGSGTGYCLRGQGAFGRICSGRSRNYHAQDHGRGFRFDGTLRGPFEYLRPERSGDGGRAVYAACDGSRAPGGERRRARRVCDEIAGGIGEELPLRGRSEGKRPDVRDRLQTPRTFAQAESRLGYLAYAELRRLQPDDHGTFAAGAPYPDPSGRLPHRSHQIPAPAEHREERYRLVPHGNGQGP